MKPRVDINCDLGESYGAYKVGNDEKIMPHITSANVACGFHGGDPTTIAQTINLAKKCGVAVGAHPGFPDLMGFGRREMRLTPEEVETYTIYQVSAVEGFTRVAGADLQHVKPHGALYNMATRDEKLSRSIVEAVKALNKDLIVFAPPKSALAKNTLEAGLRVAYEFFADRAYNPDGSLVSRKEAGSIIKETRQVVQRAVKMIVDGTVLATNGELLELGKIHTICLHGDTPSAARLAKTLKNGLVKSGVRVEPAGNFV